MKDTSNLNEKIIGKKHLLFLVESETNEKFGYFYDGKIFENCPFRTQYRKSFHFNLQSNGRFNTPKRMPLRMFKTREYTLFDKSHDVLIRLGNFFICKQHVKEKSYCIELPYLYFYPKIDNALCGSKHFIPKKFIVIQMN